MPMHGEFTLTLWDKTVNNVTSVWFSGPWTYGTGATAVTGATIWTDVRVNSSRPTARQCFTSSVAGNRLSSASAVTWSGPAPWSERLAGRFKVMSGTPPAVFDLCVANDGSTTGSYNYSLPNGEAVTAYQVGSCFGGGMLCSGSFYEQFLDGSTMGGSWLAMRTSAGVSDKYQALDMWWYGTRSEIVLSNYGNTNFSNVDEQVMSGLAGDCAANVAIGTMTSRGGFSLWDGSWSDSVASDGYGGELRLCSRVSSGGVRIVEGLYSETGYVRGMAVGRTLVGEWFEPGLAGTTANYGNFTLTLSSDGTYFTGTWGYGSSVTNGGTWDESRLSWSQPSASQCWTTNTVGTTAAVGGKMVTAGGSKYDVCVDGSSSLSGSYTYVYSADNSTVLGSVCTRPTVVPGVPR